MHLEHNSNVSIIRQKKCAAYINKPHDDIQIQNSQSKAYQFQTVVTSLTIIIVVPQLHLGSVYEYIHGHKAGVFLYIWGHSLLPSKTIRTSWVIVCKISYGLTLMVSCVICDLPPPPHYNCFFIHILNLFVLGVQLSFQILYYLIPCI